MIPLYIVSYIMLIHWIADFICQTRWQAENKSRDLDALFGHVMTYSAVFLIAMLPILGLTGSILFTAITYITHVLTDFFTSRFNSWAWTHRPKLFWVGIGFDQYIHLVTLCATYLYIV